MLQVSGLRLVADHVRAHDVAENVAPVRVAGRVGHADHAAFVEHHVQEAREAGHAGELRRHHQRARELAVRRQEHLAQRALHTAQQDLRREILVVSFSRVVHVEAQRLQPAGVEEQRGVHAAARAASQARVQHA